MAKYEIAFREYRVVYVEFPNGQKQTYIFYLKQVMGKREAAKMALEQLGDFRPNLSFSIKRLSRKGIEIIGEANGNLVSSAYVNYFRDDWDW